MSAVALRRHLSAAAAARLGAVDWLESLDSTNAELLRRGAAQPDFALLVADAQSAGRGRRGRAWHSPPQANLYCSLYLQLPRGARQAAGLSLVVGVAAAEALHALGAQAVRLKWPNDLLARGRKLGGVLVELGGAGAVIGIGINLRMPADAAADLDQPWTDLAALGVDVPREQVAARLVEALLPRLAAFRDDGLDAGLRARWETLHAHAGCEVRVLDAAQAWHGRALGLAEDGALRVATADGERRVHGGDVSLRPA
jgi:BirA family biotin operon repressor/biotin-[acetyl-CoA-carboxylase] ligase